MPRPDATTEFSTPFSGVIAKTSVYATSARARVCLDGRCPPGFERTLSPMPQQDRDLTLGEPIYAQALYYTAMFSQKPFREALPRLPPGRAVHDPLPR